MNIDTATKIIIKPYITEKVFSMIEDEGKICFIVNQYSNKHEILEAIQELYHEKGIKINTARTQYGKKAFVKFKDIDKARELATKIGML